MLCKKGKQFEKNIQSLQDEITALNTTLSDPEIYESESTASLANMMQKKSGLESRLNKVESQWYAATETLEELESSIAASGK